MSGKCSVCKWIEGDIRYFRDVPEESYVVVKSKNTHVPVLISKSHSEEYTLSGNSRTAALLGLNETATLLYGDRYCVAYSVQNGHHKFTVRLPDVVESLEE